MNSCAGSSSPTGGDGCCSSSQRIIQVLSFNHRPSGSSIAGSFMTPVCRAIRCIGK
jgi:hypothetical protein